MKKHLTFKDDKSDKFWEIEVTGTSFTITYGKAGTEGQTSTKEFDTEEKCMKEAEKLVSEKLKKGYEETSRFPGLLNPLKENSFETLVAPFFGQLCIIKSEAAYVFNWDKIGKENKESFLECYEGCDFIKAIEGKTLLPFSIIDASLKQDASKKKYSLTSVMEILGGGELASVLFLKKATGAIYVSDEGGELSLFCESPSSLEIKLKEIEEKDKKPAKGVVISESEFSLDYINKIKKAVEKKDWFNFSSGRLKSLPEQTWELIHLQEFDAFDNQLSSLPAGIGKLVNLRKINIRANKLVSLPPEIGLLTNLGELIIDTNELQTLPPEIGRLKKLEKLDLSKNRFKTLLPEISGITGLKILSLSKNKALKDLPMTMSEMINLDTLWLNDSGLEKVPDVLMTMTRLKKLNIWGTKIEPAELTNLKKRLSKTDVTTFKPY